MPKGRKDHEPGGIMVQLADTQLHVVKRGEGYPLFVLHGGPGQKIDDSHKTQRFNEPQGFGIKLCELGVSFEEQIHFRPTF